MFMGFKNIDFFVLRGVNEEDSRFTIAKFPIINPNDFIVLLDMLKHSARNEAESVSVFTDAKNHIFSFFKNYMLRFAKFDITVAKLFGQSLAPPPTTIGNFGHLKAGQIVDKPCGVIFKGLSSDSETMVTKFFEIDYGGLYPSESIQQVLGLVNNCFVNTADEKKKVKDYLNWWLQLRHSLNHVYKTHYKP
ncbi:hypothetical protein L1887_14750 [Cichorium endivia]|nr:hypothetical protein L1887_14750 [Cichorium endivia]